MNTQQIDEKTVVIRHVSLAKRGRVIGSRLLILRLADDADKNVNLSQRVLEKTVPTRLIAF
jgi:hypothetical protein